MYVGMYLYTEYDFHVNETLLCDDDDNDYDDSTAHDCEACDVEYTTTKSHNHNSEI